MLKDRVGSIVERGAVKLHIFHPSGRKFWTVVGRDNEHWADPDLMFCSCKNYYFKSLSNNQPCYHLKGIWMSRKQSKFVKIDFDDTEYIGFTRALAEDNEKKLFYF